MSSASSTMETDIGLCSTGVDGADGVDVSEVAPDVRVVCVLIDCVSFLCSMLRALEATLLSLSFPLSFSSF